MTCNNPKLDNVNINVYTKFGQILFIHLFILKILSKNQILTLIKGRNSATNLRNTAPYILNLGLVNNNVYGQNFFYFPVLGTFGVKHRVGGGNKNKNEIRKMLQSE